MANNNESLRELERRLRMPDMGVSYYLGGQDFENDLGGKEWDKKSEIGGTVIGNAKARGKNFAKWQEPESGDSRENTESRLRKPKTLQPKM